MNKQEALDYIESGKEAVQARNMHSVSSGDAVRLLGYGYDKPGKWSHSARWRQREDWEFVKRDGANGVLVEYINPLHYKRFDVVQLRQLFATTRAEAEADYMRRAEEAERERERRMNEEAAQVERAKQLIEQLGMGSLGHRYGVRIELTVDQAQEIVDELRHLGALRNDVVGSMP